MEAHLILNPGTPSELHLVFVQDSNPGFAKVLASNPSGQLVGVVKVSGRDNGDIAAEVLPTTGHPIDCYVGNVNGGQAYKGTA